MAAVHGHEVVVEVDEEVALGCAPVDAKDFLVSRLADCDHPVGVFGVVVVEAFGPELFEDARADHALDLPLGHASVERDGDDEVNVVNAVGVQEVEKDFERGLTDVGRAHRRQGHRDVVNRNRHLHARLKLRVERVAVVRVVQGVAYGGLAVRQAFDGRVRVDDARADGQVFEYELHARRDDARRAVAVNVDDRLVDFSSEL